MSAATNGGRRHAVDAGNVDRLMEGWAALPLALPRTMAGLVDVLGFGQKTPRKVRSEGTKAAAAALGVDRRTVQRFIHRETHGKTSTNRGFGPDEVDKVRRAAVARAGADNALGNRLRAAAVRARGVNILAPGTFFISADESWGEVRNTITGGRMIPMTGADLSDMLAAIERGEWESAFVAWETTIFDAYGLPQSRYQTEYVPGGLEDVAITIA